MFGNERGREHEASALDRPDGVAPVRSGQPGDCGPGPSGRGEGDLRLYTPPPSGEMVVVGRQTAYCREGRPMTEPAGGAVHGPGLIVFGDDGSPGADVAWLWVCNHPWPGWRAEVVTATPPPFPPPSWEYRGDMVEWDSPHPRILVAQSGLASVRHLTGVYDPRVLLGERSDADLLVVGSRGLGHLRALLVGSTAEWLLHHPPAPLVIVRRAAPVRSVVACVDGSGHAQAAVEAFARLPWAKDTRVKVLTVYDGRVDVDAGQAGALKVLSAAGVTASAQEVRGKPTQVILEELSETQPQLILLGTRGLTGWRRLRLGSTAAAVVRAADCSSLVACADDSPDGADATATSP